MEEASYESDPDDERVLWITVGGVPWRAVDARLFRGRPPLPSLERGFENAFDELEARLACRFALKCLSRRAYFKRELAEELKRRLVSKEGIEKALADCARLGYLDEEAHLQAFLEGEKRRGSGPALILKKLTERGFSKEEAERFLGGGLSEEELIRQMGALVEKKMRGKASLDVVKLRSLLTRKGYPHPLIRKFLSSFFS